MPHPSTLFLGLVVLLAAFAARADETCQSPSLPNLVGQEEFVYIRTVLLETAPAVRAGLGGIP